ncbi:MAG: LTA synthase family protein [Acutalibacteraceae bacterium]|nr:LTA synthase family protein [Acutalibacteraceae bacterium]
MNISIFFDKVKYFFKNTVPESNALIKEFFVNNFEVSYTKRSKIIGAIVSAILTLVVIFDHKAFTNLETSAKWILLSLALILPSIIGVAITYTIKIKNNLINKIWHYVFLMLLPIVTMGMTECLNNIFIYDMTYLGFFANYVTLILFYFLFFATTGSLRVAILAVNPIFFGLALAHCYIMEFRGTPFIPMDFLSITTAAGVANTYSFKLMHTVLIGSLLFILIIVLGIKTNTPKCNIIEKIISRTFTGTFFAIVVSLFYFTSIFADAGIKPDFWNQTRGYRNYGFAFNFVCNTKYLYMSVPNGYNPDDVGDFVDNTVEDNEQNIVVTENAPNIICIMNESLSDLSVLGEFTTNEDYMPFMRSLTENTVKGNLYVPVIGAGTSNTEFEFLTGHSTAFLPSGSNAYMLYIKNPIASLVSTLEGQGYSSYTLHPYYSSGWNRVSVYENMGFNKFVALENIMDISLMNEYIQNGNNADYLQMLVEQTYPDRDKMLVRQYISDHYNYKLLIEDFENRDKNIPYFSFNVTMQNHGGYTSGASNFDECISITSSDVYYNKASKYLSLVKESDNAFRELIEYFSNVNEPTVICMFGDHQPSIETQFIASLLGVNNLSNLTIEQEQQRHATPFFIWANYDIEEKYIDKLSANYLSSYVLDVAGVKLTEYNKYLLKLSETLPVIDTVGYIDNNNNYYKWSDSSEYKNILGEYEKIQYNNIFDSAHKDNDIFYIEGFVPQTERTEED